MEDYIKRLEKIENPSEAMSNYIAAVVSHHNVAVELDRAIQDGCSDKKADRLWQTWQQTFDTSTHYWRLLSSTEKALCK